MTDTPIDETPETTDSGATQRHEIFPSLLVDPPVDYPQPKAGPATQWDLMTPSKEPVGTLVFNDAGLTWKPADTEDVEAQEYGAEVLSFLRGNRDQGTPLQDALDAVRAAYTGDLTEASVKYIPSR